MCNKARAVFYYQNKSESTMHYVLYVAYDKYPTDILRLEVTSTVAGICLEDGAICNWYQWCFPPTARKLGKTTCTLLSPE